MELATQLHVVACIIQGEGEMLGAIGMYAVASTIAQRLADGQTIERIDREYYGNDADKGGCTAPGELARGLANDVLIGRQLTQGYSFCYSFEDTKHGGFPPADFTLTIDGGGPGRELHLYREWPVATLRRKAQ